MVEELEIKKKDSLFSCVCAQSLQSCLTLGDPMNCSLPGSSVHGVFQERILEWVACSPPGDLLFSYNPLKFIFYPISDWKYFVSFLHDVTVQY